MQLSDLKAGDCVCLDDGFTCMREGPHIVEGDENGLFIKCDEGKHYIEGQEDDETGELVGIAPVDERTTQELREAWKVSSTTPA